MTSARSENAPRAERILPSRTWLVVVVLTSGLAAATRLLPDAWATTWILRVLAANVLIGIIPGMLTVLAWRPRPSFALLELVGLSMGVSFALVEVLTVAVVTLHLSPMAGIALLATLSTAHVAVAARQRNDGVSVGIDPWTVALAAAIGIVALYLYAAGSPFNQAEDRYHIAVAQRLAYLEAPSIETLYFSPGIAYMYPFPGTHYMMALMSRVGDIDLLFLYHKLRMFWGMASLVLFYGCACALFERRRIAIAATATAIAFVANGTFATVPGLYWAQMAPYSHASDVAMGVLLPVVLLLALGFLRSRARRESGFYLGATLAMASALIVVHPREIVQFLVYLGAFIVTVLLMRGPRPLVRRAAVLLGSTVAFLVAYRLWYVAREHVFAADDVIFAQYAAVTDHRDRLYGLLVESSWAELFGAPLPLLDAYMPGLQLMFFGWNPIVLVASPLVLYLLRRPLAWLPAASIVVYTLIITFPAAAILFAYVTYFEILYTPVRNVILFVYLLAGASLYAVAARLARHGYATIVIGALTIAGAAVGMFRWFGPFAAGRPRLLFMAVLAGYVVAGVGLWRARSAPAAPDWIDRPRPRWALAFALLLVPIVAGTWNRESAVVRLSWSNHAPTPEALVANLECPAEGQFCPPPRELIRFARERVPANAVLAVDFLETYQPSLFMPQQMVVWTGELEGIPDPERMFRRYYRHLNRVRAASRDQPFFDLGETRDERLAFIRDLAVTYVLINPRLYPSMKPVLDRDADLFTSRYDDGRWALYEVTR